MDAKKSCESMRENPKQRAMEYCERHCEGLLNTHILLTYSLLLFTSSLVLFSTLTRLNFAKALFVVVFQVVSKIESLFSPRDKITIV